MTTVKELYEESIEYGEKILAHYIFHLLQEQQVSLDDDVSKLDFLNADQATVAEMIKQNILGFRNIDVYALKLNDNLFAFVFASSKEEAMKFIKEKHIKSPVNCHQYPLDFPMHRGNEFLSFREMLKEHSKFPALAGFFERR